MSRARGVVALNAAAACLAVLAAAAPLRAQSWTAEARVGRLDFDLSPTGAPATTSVAVGLGFAAEDLRFHLAAGVPTSDEDPLWGALDLNDRWDFRIHPLTLGVETAGQFFLQRYTKSIESPGNGIFDPPTLGEEAAYGYGLAAQVMPFIGFGAGPVRVEARVGASVYRTAIDDLDASRGVGLADLRVLASPADALAFTAEVRHFAAEDGNWTYGGLGALMTAPGAEFWGTLGRWFGDRADGEGMPWSAGVSFRLAERVDAVVEARQDAHDPLYRSQPRRAWSAALRLRLADPPPPAAPVPAAYDAGVATIALPAADLPEDAVRAEAGEAPRVAGDFNDWTPEPMVRDGDRWVWRGRLEPGVYEYSFVAPDGFWFVPESTPGRKDDGMGGWVALLIVGEEGA